MNITHSGSSTAVVGSQTWFCVLELLLLVVVHHNVRLHRDQLLLVELAQVQQGELVKLLVAEEHLIGLDRQGTRVRLSTKLSATFPGFSTSESRFPASSPPCPSVSWPRSRASARPGGGWGRTGSGCCACPPSCATRTPSGWSAGPPAAPTTRTSAAWQCPPAARRHGQ